MDKYVCDCCGGKINTLTMTCEYCGTKYKRDDDDWAKPIRIETYRNPINTYTACVKVDAYDVQNDPTTTSRIAVEELAHELAKSIAPNMVVETQRDIYSGGYLVYGTVRVVKPINGADKWRIQ